MAAHRLRPVTGGWRTPADAVRHTWVVAVVVLLATVGLGVVAARLVPAIAVVALLVGSTGTPALSTRPAWYAS